MKIFITSLTEIFVFLLIITQIILPAIVPGMRYFWAFRGKEKSTPPPSTVSITPDELSSEIDEAAVKSKTVKDKANAVHAQATELKKKADNI